MNINKTGIYDTENDIPTVNADRWKSATQEELVFWRNTIENPDSKHYHNFKKRCEPNKPLNDFVEKYCSTRTNNIILDVGSGPISIVGTTHKLIDFEVIAIDPLANEYHKILLDNKVYQATTPISLAGEDISQMFQNNYFDIAYARNSIDHSLNPVKIVSNMINVVKPDGFIVMTHIHKQAPPCCNGLHNWSFTKKLDDFIIKTLECEINVSELFADRITTEHISITNRFINVVYKKRR